MAGGTFNSQGKIRPGTYVNVENGQARAPISATRGVAVLPLIGYDWGERGKFLKVTPDSPDANIAELGRSIYDSNDFMRMVRLMLMNAATVYLWIPDEGAKATKSITIGENTLTATAKFKGTLGNTLKVVSVANAASGFDISIEFNGGTVEEFEGLATVAALKAAGSEYIDFSGTDANALTAFASATLTGGTDTTSGSTAVTSFLDACETLRFNCMAFPSSDNALHAALLTKIKYIRETIGWKCQAVAPNFAADYEGIINLTNGFVYDGSTLSALQCTAWLAGATAGAEYTDSLTYAAVTGATAVNGGLTHAASEAAILAGKSFFSVAEDGSVILEYDINSLVTASDDKPANANKNRPLRVYDSWCNDCLTTFVPGRYSNDSDGWTVMEGLGRALLAAYERDGAITNVNMESDFYIDQSRSSGDSTYIIAGLQAVDSADKYYITTIAR